MGGTWFYEGVSFRAVGTGCSYFSHFCCVQLQQNSTLECIPSGPPRVSTTVFSISDAAADGERVRAGNPFLTATAGLWLHGSNMSFDASGFGPYYSDYATDWVHWGGHTHTLGGIRGRDKLAK